MRKWLSILLNILVWLLPPGGTAVVVILAWLQRVPWYLIVLSAIATIALILLGINQFALFRQRRQKPLSKRTDKEIENTIRDWLYQPRYKFQMVEDVNCHFKFVITDEGNRIVTITRANNKPSILVLSTAISLNEGQRKKFESIDSYQKEKMAYDLRIEMARYGIGYIIDTDLKRNFLDDVILLDDLDEFSLYRRIFYVTGAVALYSEVIGQSLITIGEQGKHK